ncbi:uncharacterized protein LOC134690398 [Mytilus trossulus]|uniref:uncharacterized protein LOC134690398 n=1 Tax=Mytilus trossulus TaxID=6551 RepID=UPI003003B498
MLRSLLWIVCLILTLNMQRSLSEEEEKLISIFKEKLGIPKNIGPYYNDGKVGISYTGDNGKQVGAHVKGNEVGIHGKTKIGGWEVTGELNKGVGSKGGVGGGISVSKSFSGGGSSWWRRKRSIACMAQCNNACSQSVETCVVNCIRNMC